MMGNIKAGITGTIVLLLQLAVVVQTAHGFFVVPWRIQSTRTTRAGSTAAAFYHKQHRRHAVGGVPLMDSGNADDKNTGEVGSGPNWIERSFPVDVSGTQEEEGAAALKKVEYYNVGVSGVAFETGPLSRRMFDTMMSTNADRFQSQIMNDDIRKAFTLYAMDFTAKEATRAALKQNGLEMTIPEDMQDEGDWGDVSDIRLLDVDTNEPVGEPFYDTVEEAIEDWTPGQPFDFVARQVPAKLFALSMEEFLQALDPDGKLRKEAHEKGMTLPDEEITTLQALANDCMRRSNVSPREALEDAFAGVIGKRGYKVISRSALLRDSLNVDGSENDKTLMHVMDALVSHSALVVDLTDGGTTYKSAMTMANMWKTIEQFYTTLDENPDLAASLPGMTSVKEAGVSPHAKVGYASYDNGSMQFLETRFKRNEDMTLLPKEAQEILGADGVKALRDAFDVVCDVGKDVVRIATAASSMEANAFGVTTESSEEEGPSISGMSFSGEDDEAEAAAKVRATEAAILMVDELVDDARPLKTVEDSTLSMSPHRVCRYRNKMNETEKKDEEIGSSVAREVFGSHTDSSFATLVPVAAVSGLEVLDEDTDQWYRPELNARKHWEAEQEKRGKDPSAMFETIPALDEGEKDSELPWYARYIIVMPGEFLQLATRNEVRAAVHRVVGVKDGPPRLSAPILLRGRPGTEFDVVRYLGSDEGSPLLTECDGRSMEDIHNAMQPSPFQ